MADLFTSIFFAVAVAGLIYTVLEFREIFNTDRDGPQSSMTGAESMKGRSAVVSKAFALSGSGAFVGRVRFNGEDWRAEYAGDSSQPPGLDRVVTIREVDSAKLTVKAE